MINSANQHRLRFLLILGTLSATGPLSIDLYLPALPQMVRQFHTTTAMMQLSITACLLGLAVGQLISGPLSDHFGRRKPLFIGFIVFGLASLAIAVSHSVSLLIGLRFVQGLAGAAGQVLSRAVARDLFSGKALTQFYALLNSVNGLFPILAPIIGGFMIKFVPWSGIFILLGVIGFLLSGLILIGIPETLRPENRLTGPVFQSFLSFGTLLKQQGFFSQLLITGVVYGSLFSYIAASTFIYQQLFHLSAQSFSLIYALNGLGIVIGSGLPARLTGISTYRQLSSGIGLCMADAMALLLGAYLHWGLVMIAVLIFLLVIGVGMLLTLTTAIIMGETTQNAGGASALIGLSQNAFGGLSSPLVGLFGTNSLAPMAGLVLIYNLIAGGLAYRVHHQLHK
ncbi:Bcr/CflA family drug resistance efflux transporter [Secundilactobacillus paracollinoides]|uniref:Bcr/CflA family efflux transporter n=2 Tax=Secundilactobacillus paracollinoides TaxID=240427 RepID=A0A1B2IWZ0_9LACO|nr:multidrug effflux MFS transporter [Secundilactobacillus paracollinoides]ANZ60708.1 Bcr/CflA family drug resistance efflux transporter [Secundilactobacillus paracollinoides]ANZ65083.1 Bcr/CflA family drug resistance efflux transporter [Secundilactobacillus paracollinoides]ANZ66551.1 Bcr/CflA family drug resistance efflux transporter [Secundilactobacillus paracollinoides]KRL79421.1 major facilitator superfamily permease [Secundilactobacillus paracollinoides DSM 15502 = JCM 11969]